MKPRLKNMCKKFSAVNALILAVLFLTALPLMAMDLTQAKEQGLIGETDGGYLALVSSSNQEASALVKDINLKRRAQYQSIARQNGISISDVEALAGKKAIEKTPSGQYVKVNDQWQKK